MVALGLQQNPGNFLRDYPDQGWLKFKGDNINSEQLVTAI